MNDEIKFVDTIDNFRGKYSFLSNFHEHTIVYKGKTWKSSEHAYQAMKTNDTDMQEAIREAATPGMTKKMGKTVILRPDWETVKVDIMKEILLAKFSDKQLQKQLLETDDADLIEGNTWGDTYWGVCDGKGQNMLGKLLMKVRDFYSKKGE